MFSFSEPEIAKQKITPALMFTCEQSGKAEDAINFYTSLFEDSGVVMISRYTKTDNDVEGNVSDINKSERVMKAFLKMKKFDIEKLMKA